MAEAHMQQGLVRGEEKAVLRIRMPLPFQNLLDGVDLAVPQRRKRPPYSFRPPRAKGRRDARPPTPKTLSRWPRACASRARFRYSITSMSRLNRRSCIREQTPYHEVKDRRGGIRNVCAARRAGGRPAPGGRARDRRPLAPARSFPQEIYEKEFVHRLAPRAGLWPFAGFGV